MGYKSDILVQSWASASRAGEQGVTCFEQSTINAAGFQFNRTDRAEMSKKEERICHGQALAAFCLEEFLR